MLACRFCRTSMDAEGGCDMCSDFRRHLVSVDEDADAHPALADVTAEALRGMRTILRGAKGNLEHEDPRTRAHASRDFIVATNALAKVVEAARKLQADGFAVIRAMSFAERADLFIAWYTGLAPAHRSRLREQMEKHELAVAKPVPERRLSAGE